jgi:gamma-glutamylcyclotransferase (GGCT)/AIG2-like uncharacterized protein YtfP
MSAYLFTYGTLQPGLAPAEIAAVVEQLTVVGEGFVHGRLYDLGEYAGAVLDSDSGDRVFGTLYQLPDEPSILRMLDVFEGFDEQVPDQSDYLRARCEVTLRSGTVVDAWVYVCPCTPAPERLVPGGVFKRKQKG